VLDRLTLGVYLIFEIFGIGTNQVRHLGFQLLRVVAGYGDSALNRGLR
jgi:hypothetical protein